MKLTDLTGQRFGKLTVISRACNQVHGNQERRMWNVLCECGSTKIVAAQSLRKAKSCGCLRRQVAERNRTHGLYYTDAWRMWHAAKGRAKRKGLSFDIEVADIVVPEYCPLLGIKLEKGTKGFNPSSPSLDKIVPELGYVKGNIWVVSMKANTIKQDASLEELESLVEALRKVWPDGREEKR